MKQISTIYFLYNYYLIICILINRNVYIFEFNKILFDENINGNTNINVYIKTFFLLFFGVNYNIYI